MPTITISLNSGLRPQSVLAAAVDFSGRRSKIFPAVEQKHLTVHSVGETSADVTEGTGTGIGVSWERCRYDWHRTGMVTATVTDSNVYAVGSKWELTVDAADDGSRVEMAWLRRFRRSPRGALFATAFRLIGRPMFRRYARQIMANMEAVAAEPSSS